MGRNGCHDTQNGALLGQNGQLAAQQHALIHAAHGGKPQEAFFGDLSDEKSDLVNVGIQHDGLCTGDAAVPVAQNIAEVVDLHPVTVGRHHFCGNFGNPELIAGYTINRGQSFDLVCESQICHPF